MLCQSNLFIWVGGKQIFDMKVEGAEGDNYQDT